MTALHIHDNQQFLDWLKDHPNGYVLNTYLNPSPNYMMLHTAGCSWWREDYDNDKGAFTDKYSKVVAESIYELQEWMKNNGRSDGNFTGTGCKRCSPMKVKNEINKVMTIFEQVVQVCEAQNQDNFSRSEIIDLVVKKFGRNPTSIIPADYCYNRINNGIDFTKHAFIFIEDGKYQFVGENFAYSGYIFAGEDEDRRIVGLWENGKFCLWEDFPKVSKEHPKRTYDSIGLASYNSTFLKEVESSLRDSSTARQARLKKAAKIPTKIAVVSQVWVRNPDVIAEVLARANGQCEKCCKPAPFYRKKDGTPYLEVHHKIQLANDGEDTIENAIALCPNCHREQHFGKHA